MHRPRSLSPLWIYHRLQDAMPKGPRAILNLRVNLAISGSIKTAGGVAMTVTEDNKSESRPFEADVAKLLHLMVHSVYSDKSVFLRELIANAADACERLRYEAIAQPALFGDSPGDVAKPRITVAIEAAQGADAEQKAEDNALIGRFGVGFYSAFMVAERVEVISHRAGGDQVWRWSSDGKGAYDVSTADAAEAPARGTRVILHLLEDAKKY